MEVTTTARFVRMSPLKMRDLANVIRGKPVEAALRALQFSHRKGAFLILKTLKSAVANAENNAKLSAEDLIVKEAAIEKGPSMKRYRPRARGSAGRILKRMSHIRIVLDEKTPGAASKAPRKE